MWITTGFWITVLYHPEVGSVLSDLISPAILRSGSVLPPVKIRSNERSLPSPTVRAPQICPIESSTDKPGHRPHASGAMVSTDGWRAERQRPREKHISCCFAMSQRSSHPAPRLSLQNLWLTRPSRGLLTRRVATSIQHTIIPQAGWPSSL